MIERRRRPRVRLDSVAFIVTKTGNPVTCRIVDRSPDGARLFVDSVFGIPNEFRLVVQKTDETLSASVVWRGPQEIGVAFMEPADHPALLQRTAARSPIEIAPDALAEIGASGAVRDVALP